MKVTTSNVCRLVPLSVLVLCALQGLFTPAVQAQGSLTPPGAPGETMKTLQQVEPRTPIAGPLPLTITNSGSYYFITNLTGPSGITIAASDVTLDLMGFELVGGTGVGISAGHTTGNPNGGGSLPQTNICIRNGTIRGWSEHGIAAGDSVNCQFRSLRLRDNGDGGLTAGIGSIISDCQARSNSFGGIVASFYSVVTDCIAQGNGASGIAASAGTIERCNASGNGIGIGGRLVIACVAANNGSDGIRLDSYGLASGCTATANNEDGIEADFNSTVTGNNCSGNGAGNNFGAGIRVSSTGNRIEGNQVNANDRGIDVADVGNLIIKNSARGNGTNYVIVSDNRYGPIVNIAPGGTAAVNSSSAASTLTTVDPWANFSH